MNDTAEPRSKAQDTVAMTAATMGHDIVAMILNELRRQPGAWSSLAADYQQRTIDEFKTKVSDMVKKSISFMLTSDFQAVSAKVEYVNRGKGVKAGLTVASNEMYRHALFDAAGQHVLLVIADPKQWLQRMDEIKARGDQLDLFDPDANYDPERDQPGYRRDRDPLAPGASWEELKRSLGVEPPPPGETKSADPAPPLTDLTPEQEREAMLRQVQEELAGYGIEVSLGALQARDDQDILAATVWLDECKVGKLAPGKPAWLPEPKG